MSSATERSAEVVDELRALAAEAREDLAPQEAELRELGVLIKQTAAEVDRITPLRNDAAKRVREMELNVEHFSRPDIAQSYANATETQMRLFMMQSRLEQLEYKQRILERNRRNLLRFAALAEQLPASAPESEDAPDVGVTSTEEVLTQIVQAEEDQRQRCAVAVHDGAAQGLTNLVLRAQLCERLIETDEARAREELAGLHEALATALQETRLLIYDLRPLTVEDVGLTLAIQKYVQAVVDRTEAPVELRMSRGELRLDTAVEIALFRLVQEALSNAIRHSRAGRIQVTIAFDENSFRVLIEDDGAGFSPPATLQAARQARHLGIATMLERAALLGATVTFDSKPGRGTRVRVRYPLGSETDSAE